MALRTAIKYAAIGIGVLVLISVALTIVSVIVGLVWTVMTIAATLVVLAGLGYGVVKGVQWWRAGGTGSVGGTTDGSRDRSPVERLTERYVDGELSEDELERRLDRVLGGPTPDEIDRELERTKGRS